MRPALDVVDALPLELVLELGVPRQLVYWRPWSVRISRGAPYSAIATRQRLQHERAALVMRQRQTHQVARVIVQERRHVQPLVLTQQEREQIRLPQLIRLGTLEPVLPRLRLGTRFRPGSANPLACSTRRTVVADVPSPK